MSYQDITSETHPLYDDMLPKWKKCRDSVSGEDDIKAGGVLYLPKQGTETSDEDYAAYKNRSNFLGITRRTVESLTGIAFKEVPTMNSDDWGEVQYLVENVDGAGSSLYEQAKAATWDTITTGRAFLYVDYPKSESNTLAEDEKLKASIQLYTAEQVINWGTAIVDGQKVLTYAVLKEPYNASESEFAHDVEFQYRLLFINEEGNLVGVVISDGGEIIEEEYEIIASGENLKYIPLYLISSSGEGIDTKAEPPMLKVANVNLAHYRTDAEMRMCMHYHSMPQPVISGTSQQWRDQFKDSPLKIGTDEVLLLEKGAEFSLHQIEFNSTGYHNELQRLKESAVEIGARLVLSNGGGVESAETVRLKGAGDISVLGSILLSVTQAYEKAVITASKFMGADLEDVSIEVATELIKPMPDGSLLAGLLNAQMRGIVGSGAILDYLRSTGVIKAGMTDEEIEQDIANSITGIPFPEVGEE